jgi:putative addiction module component (TIGR02574 family)
MVAIPITAWRLHEGRTQGRKNGLYVRCPYGEWQMANGKASRSESVPLDCNDQCAENPWMGVTFEQLAHDALTLSESERAQLVQTLLRSLEPLAEQGVDEAWDAEVASRVDRVHQGVAHGRPAEDVFRDIRARYQT